MKHPTYGPSVLLLTVGAGMVLFGILSTTDDGTIGGTVFGMMSIGAGLSLALDVADRRRRRRRYTPGPLLTLDPREVEKIRRARASDAPTVRNHRPDLWV